MQVLGSILSGKAEQQTHLACEEEFAMTNRKVLVCLVVGGNMHPVWWCWWGAIAQAGLTPNPTGEGPVLRPDLSLNNNQSCAVCHGPSRLDRP